MNLHLERRLEVLAKEIAAKNEPRLTAEACAAFLSNTSVKLPSGVSTFITEADCRQIKGAAKDSQKAEKVAGSRPSPVAAPPFKVGDRFIVRHNTGHSYNGTEGVITNISITHEGWFDATMDTDGAKRISWRRDTVEFISTWKDCSEDMPDLMPGAYEWRYEGGKARVQKIATLHEVFENSRRVCPDMQYREIQS